VEARFLCRGCTTAIACASYLTERLLALPIGDWKAVTAESISNALGDLPPATKHGAQLAADALRTLERELAKR
jgi:NifU-like protein involved in Fe-S cluster formation